MKKLFSITASILVMALSYAQGQQVIFKEINQLKASGAVPKEVKLVNFQSIDIHHRDYDLQELSKGTIVSLSKDVIETLLRNRNNFIQIQLPVDDRSEITLTLMRNEIFTPDFTVFASSDPHTPFTYTPGIHYKGVVDGEPSSVVALSVFNDQVMGMIATDQGNFVLGRLDNDPENRHIFYNDRDLDAPFLFECETPDDGVGYTKEQLSSLSGPRDPGDCIRVYIEINHDIVIEEGGATNAINLITSVFNQSFTLYANEGITMSISEIKAWTTTSPYSGNSPSQLLTSYQNNTGPFNGDLSHLVSFQVSGGVAGSASGICNSNPDLSKCFSGFWSGYIVVPIYSWPVHVVTHEMGHLIGCRHTHACVWNFNNTAIDGCAGQTEGNCPLPGNPPGGGTIMSYCHLVTGIFINFNLGFGTQPGNVIRNTVNTLGNCLSSSCNPPPPAYCWSEGGNYQPGHAGWIQSIALESINNNSGNNSGYGDYTGQSTTLSTGTAYTITITAGNQGINWGKSWAVWIDYNHDLDFDDPGEQVATGGGSLGVNLTFTVPASSPSVTTRMRVGMKRSDQLAPLLSCGIAVSGEVEDYTIAVDVAGGPTCADGAQNGDETGVDCGGATCPICPECNDGIQNGDEEGVDCGGSCPNECPGTILFGHFFETGWDGWTDGGADVARYSGNNSWEGNYSINLQDNDGEQSAMTSPVVNLTGYTSVQLVFYFKSNSMENGDDFLVRYYNGSAYSTVATFAAGYGGNFTNTGFWVATVTLTSAQVSFVPNARFRIQCDAADNNDDVYIDAVTLTGYNSTALMNPGQWVRSAERDDDIGLSSDKEEREVILYPNPATDHIQIHTNKEVLGDITIYDASGRKVFQNFVSGSETRIDVTNLAAGVYFVRSDHSNTLKFIKN